MYRAGYDMIEGEEYLGATGLHLAIAYGNDEVAEMLILSISNEQFIECTNLTDSVRLQSASECQG